MKSIVAVAVLFLIQPAFCVQARSAETVTAPDVTGCWSGYWISCTSGHKGPLQATICKINDECYQAHFRGRFFGVVPFRYTATLRVTSRDADKVGLSGSSYLGPVMGTFRYDAIVTSTDFNAEYSSRNDRGKFVMKRMVR